MKLNLKIGAAIFAVAGLTAGLANASVISTTGAGGAPVAAANYSLEGETLYGSTGTTTLPDVTVLLNADYTLQDNIVLTIFGATVGGNTSTALNVNAGTAAAPAAGVHCWASTAPITAPPGTAPYTENSIIVSLVNVTGNAINLRVTQKNVASSVGNYCRIKGIDVTSPSIAVLTTVTAEWLAHTATTNIPFDASTTPDTILAQTISQFASLWGVTASGQRSLSGVVDVTSGRKFFFGNPSSNVSTGPAAAGNTDVANIQIKDFATGTVTAGLANAGNFFATGSPVVTLNNTVLALTGNFSELAGVGGTCTLPAPATSFVTLLTTLAPASSEVDAITSNCQLINSTITPGGPGKTDNITYTFNGTSGIVIPAPQSFTGTVKFNYTGAVAAGGTTTGVDTIAAQNPGAWTLNGFSAFVSYMPFATGISQVVYLTNKSNQTGAIQITGYTDTGVAFTANAGTIAGGKIVALGAALGAAVNAAVPSFTGKVSFNVIANIPAGLAELYTSYNVNNDRVNVVNTSNGRVTQTGTSTTGGNL